MSSRHHHYLSQCYLKGFTQGNAKKSKLTVLDLKDKKKFETIPRNVGGMRDFNRVEIDGIDPEVVEKAQSDFEGKVATALRNIEETREFQGDDRAIILELIGMLAIKSPEMREHIAKPQIEIAKKLVALEFDSKERWERQVQETLEETGEDVSGGMTFEDMKEFFESQKYDVTVTQEHQIHMELIGMQRITELLHLRDWVLVEKGDDASEFITTDNPVSLTWFDPSQKPPFLSPGFGLIDTTVYFPLSKNLALIGEFDREDGKKLANKNLIAMLNSKIIANSYQRVIASKTTFDYMATGGEMKQGNTLIQRAIQAF